MAIRLRTMTAEEYENFYRWSLENHARELMDENGLTREAALREAEEELTDLLHGVDHHLMTIEAEGPVGFLWTLHEETEGRRQSFLCDFAIWEPHRRKGYAAAALALMEQQAVRDGCQESVLFVANQNKAVQALYEKYGYRIHRPSSWGKYMIKYLDGSEHD